MNAILKKTTFLFFLLFLLSSSLVAQQNRFIYIQTENKQSFYVKLDNKLLSSSAPGYLIIPNLTDGTYDLAIGFPKNEWPEQNVTCTINKADAGYVLKNFGEKGWGLFNLQTMQLVMVEKKKSDNKVIVQENEVDAFSMILSIVVNDPSIRQKNIAQEDTVQADQKKAPSTVNKTEIVKLMTSTVPEGINMAYVDIINGMADTITIFIPYDKLIAQLEPEKELEKSKVEKIKDESKNKDVRFIDMELPNPNTQTNTSSKSINEISLAPDSSKETTTKRVMLNPACQNFASRDEFLDLRKQMVVKEDYGDMINVARERFKKSCFTTEQIKNLSSLFLRDEGKYKFFDAAYPFVSDSGNFASLETQLSDNYFITRFKAILHH